LLNNAQARLSVRFFAMNRLRFLLLAALLPVAACTTTSQVSLDYVPATGQMRPGPAEFSVREFSDQRGVEPLLLGTVRTQVGTPIERVQTRVPVAQVVTNAFAYGLEARGMLSQRGTSRYVITGEVQELYVQMLVRPYARAKVRVTVLDSSSGQIVHSEIFQGDRQGPAYVPGSGSPVPMLRDLASGALQDAVDRALDDPVLRNRTATTTPAPRYEPGML
jgi:hypothetical protein